MGEAKRRNILRSNTGESITAGSDAESIRVSLTGPENRHCFRVIVGRPFKGPAFSMLFHGRSLMDLHHKLSLTFMDRNNNFLSMTRKSMGLKSADADAADATCEKLSHMALPERFGCDQDLDTSVTHDGNGLFLFDIANVQFSLEMCSALKLWISIGQAYWEWLGVLVDTENDILSVKE